MAGAIPDPSSSALRWRSVPPDALAWRHWGEEWVVRNERNGNTHLLGPVAGRVLELLAHAPGPLATAELTAALDPTLGASAASVEDVLTEFRRLGIAEALPG
ncbi:MAG TPA: HPr-rel-A system PqqD family peptide chaperone [Casimicrobiaceae bacterium]|nr:HPr-rel-A system PqqD family peptide chaperone [Casimicrobiaceae bacterium]